LALACALVAGALAAVGSSQCISAADDRSGSERGANGAREA